MSGEQDRVAHLIWLINSDMDEAGIPEGPERTKAFWEMMEAEGHPLWNIVPGEGASDDAEEEGPEGSSGGRVVVGMLEQQAAAAGIPEAEYSEACLRKVGADPHAHRPPFAYEVPEGGMRVEHMGAMRAWARRAGWTDHKFCRFMADWMQLIWQPWRVQTWRHEPLDDPRTAQLRDAILRDPGIPEWERTRRLAELFNAHTLRRARERYDPPTEAS